MRKAAMRSRVRRRYLVAGISALAAIILVAGCSSPTESGGSGPSGSGTAGAGGSTTTVRYVVQAGNVEVLPIYVAKYMGFAEKYGIDLQFVTSQNPIIPLVSGSGDIGDPTGTLVIEARSQGNDVKVAATMMSGNPQPLMVAPNVNVPINSWPATFKALAGKIVGTTALGGGLDNIMKYAMSLAGVNPKTGFTDVATGSGGGQAAAFKTGRIDAGLAAPPLAQVWAENGTAKIAYDFTKAKGPASLNAPANLVAVSEKFAAQNPTAVRAFLNMLVAADKYISDPANLSKVVSIGLQYLAQGDSKSAVTEATQAMIPLLQAPCFTQTQFDGAYDQAKVDNLLKNPVTYDETLDKVEQLPQCGGS